MYTYFIFFIHSSINNTSYYKMLFILEVALFVDNIAIFVNSFTIYI